HHVVTLSPRVDDPLGHTFDLFRVGHGAAAVLLHNESLAGRCSHWSIPAAMIPIPFYPLTSSDTARGITCAPHGSGSKTASRHDTFEFMNAARMERPTASPSSSGGIRSEEHT